MHDASRRFPLPPDELADWEIPAVTAAARAFSSVHPIPHLSFDDIRQEALTAWLTHRHSYDQQRGANPKTFLNTVVRNALTDLLVGAHLNSPPGWSTKFPTAGSATEGILDRLHLPGN
jgi:DNA-directed RNA polymerase specialized sigma24 family protein